MPTITAWVLAQHMNDANPQPTTGDNETVVSWYDAWAGRPHTEQFATRAAAGRKLMELAMRRGTGICGIRVNGKAA